MKTNVSEASLRAYDRIQQRMEDQNAMVLNSMDIGKAYTRRELGILAGIENSAAARAVYMLIKSGDIVECGEKRCPHSNMTVGAVTLSLAKAA